MPLDVQLVGGWEEWGPLTNESTPTVGFDGYKHVGCDGQEVSQDSQGPPKP